MLFIFSFFRYEEVCLYNFNDPDPASNATAHFTQLVWNDTDEFGIGVAEKELNGEYCLFVAARYRPQGNVNDKEQFKLNVKQGSFDPFLNNCIMTSQGNKRSIFNRV